MIVSLWIVYLLFIIMQDFLFEFRFGIRILTYWKWPAINSIAPLQLTDYVWATLTRVTRTLHSRAPDFKSSSDLRSLAM